MTTTPEQVRSTRQRLGLTLADMADVLGIDPQTVHRWEAGSRTPPSYLWRALRDIEREITGESDLREGTS